MSKVLFKNIPSNGHVNPTLQLVDGLVKQKQLKIDNRVGDTK